MPNNDILLRWLNDAYSMEQSIIRTLEGHKASAQSMPEVAGKIESHIEATKDHADKVKVCIEKLGGSVSGIKEMGAAAMGTVQGNINRPADDTVVKNALAEYATEHFEIASYNTLAAAAETLGQQDVATVCREIVREEQEMAQWLEKRLPAVIKSYLTGGKS